MKIGFDGRFISRCQTGNGVFSQRLIEGLADLDHKNEYTIYLVEDNPFIKKNNFYLKKMPAIHANSHLRFFLSFPWEFMRNPVDIFHALYTVPLRTRARIILHLVEFGWITNPEEFPASPIFLAQLKPLIHHSISRADRIITVTHVWKEKLLNYFDTLDDEKVEVIPLGFDKRYLEICSSEEISRIKQKYGITQDYILNAGNLHPRKNLIRLIEAFNQLKESKKIPHQLVIVGKALFQADDIYRKASASPASDSIIFTGYTPFEDLRALYQGAALYAFPSINEGFGLPVHEAMASRLPVVVSNRGSLPEISGDAALIFDPLNVEEIADAIFRVLDSQSLRDELVSRGLEQIKGFYWEASCKKIVHLYEKLGAEGQRRSAH